MDWLTKLGDLAKIPTKFVVACALVTGAVLFLPTSVVERLRLTAFLEEFGGYVGAVFLVSCGVIAIETLLRIWIAIRRWWRRRGAHGRALVHLYQLDPIEKAVLREFFIHGQRTLLMPIGHPVVASLLEKDILDQVGTLGEHSLIGPLFSLTIASDIEPLVAHELIDLPREWTAEHTEWVRDHRPEFAAELDRRQQRQYRFGF